MKINAFLDTDVEDGSVKLPGLTPPVTSEIEGFDLESMPKGKHRICIHFNYLPHLKHVSEQNFNDKAVSGCKQNKKPFLESGTKQLWLYRE